MWVGSKGEESEDIEEGRRGRRIERLEYEGYCCGVTVYFQVQKPFKEQKEGCTLFMQVRQMKN